MRSPIAVENWDSNSECFTYMKWLTCFTCFPYWVCGTGPLSGIYLFPISSSLFLEGAALPCGSLQLSDPLLKGTGYALYLPTLWPNLQHFPPMEETTYLITPTFQLSGRICNIIYVLDRYFSSEEWMRAIMSIICYNGMIFNWISKRTIFRPLLLYFARVLFHS